MINEGKTPRENMNELTLHDTTELKILHRMLLKYLKVVEFYTEAKNEEQVGLAKNEMQEILRIQSGITDI